MNVNKWKIMINNQNFKLSFKLFAKLSALNTDSFGYNKADLIIQQLAIGIKFNEVRRKKQLVELH